MILSSYKKILDIRCDSLEFLLTIMRPSKIIHNFFFNSHAPPGAWHHDTVDFVDLYKRRPFGRREMKIALLDSKSYFQDNLGINDYFKSSIFFIYQNKR
jgi:hypothetical protein